MRLTYQPEIIMPGVFINSRLVNVIKSGVYQQDLINRDRLSAWLIVGKLGQGMRCCKCDSNANVLVCETPIQGE